MTSPEPLSEQKIFIERDPSAHGLLVAGPGTGKTFTLENRAEYLVEECEVDPDHITLLSLTRSMVRSLAERIKYGEAKTLHSFALGHLNRLGDAWDRQVADPWEQKNIVRGDLKRGYEQAFGIKIGLNRVQQFLERLSTSFRESQTEPQNMSDQDRQLFQVFQQQRELFRYRLMDELVFDLVVLSELSAGVENRST